MIVHGYVEACTLFKETKSSRNECGKRMREMEHMQKKQRREEKRAYMSLVHTSPHPPRVPTEHPKETRRSVIPIPAEVVSTARDATGLLPPWHPQLSE
jgi:hypothetical protein